MAYAQRVSTPLPSARLSTPHTLLLIAANLVPLAGIFLWHWDAFLLLMLYWMETAIVAFWALARLAASPVASNGAKPQAAEGLLRVGLVAFLTVHASMFMSVHFVFVWLLFSGPWRARIHGPSDFLAQIVFRSGLWLPLLFLFASGGMAFVCTVLRPAWAMGLLARLRIAPPAPVGGDNLRSILSGLYRRIITQFAIIFGAWISVVLRGSMAPFIVLILARTIADVRWPELYER